jgi:phosphate transport system permease protein
MSGNISTATVPHYDDDGGVPPKLDIRELRRSLAKPRTLFSAVCTVTTVLFVAIAVVPLFSVLYMLVTRGIEVFDWTFFTSTAPVYGRAGGVGNAIMGTVVMTLLAAAISVPAGVLSAIYLAEIGPKTALSSWVRFCAKLLTGLPSIIAGVFIFGLIVVFFGYSAWAGGAALAILMLPMVMLTSEEALKMVPAKMREAAFGMGCTRFQVIWRVLLPTAMPGILTGVMLSLARAAGETAPLLFTANYAAQSWVFDFQYNELRLNEDTSSLAVFIYQNYNTPFAELVRMAWGAALVLVLLVLFFNVLGQLISARANRHRR